MRNVKAIARNKKTGDEAKAVHIGPNQYVVEFNGEDVRKFSNLSECFAHACRLIEFQ